MKHLARNLIKFWYLGSGKEFFFFFKWGEEKLKTALQYIIMRICFLISQGNLEVNDTFWAQLKKEQVLFECFDQNLLGYLKVHHESSVM